MSKEKLTSIPVENPVTAEEKKKAADLTVSDINKEYGKGSIFNMGNRVGIPMPHISTGLFEVDNDVLGIGGLPRGRIIEIYGPSSGGKTTLSLTAVASVQRNGGLAAVCDAEHALDPSWCSTLGVDVDKLFVSQPDSGEQALEITEHLIASGAFEIVVVDSVAALVPRAELEGSFGDANMGMQARMMSQGMRKLVGVTARTGTTLVFINQTRQNIGGYGNPEVTAGGKALSFYASVRLDVRRVGPVKDGDEIIGNRVKIKGAKNKCSRPFRETEVDLLFNSGFDAIGSLGAAAVQAKVLFQKGTWYEYQTEKLGQGKNALKKFLGDPEMFKKIYEETKNAQPS